MGTDILYHAEQRSKGKWHLLKDDTGNREFFYFGAERNYNLYDLLCGTIDPNTGLTARGFVAIAPRRGPPSDYPPRKAYDECDYSWVLLQELIDYPWEQRLRHVRAFVDAGNFRAYLNGADFRYFPVSPPHLDCPVRFPRPEWIIVPQGKMLDGVSSKSTTNIYTEIEFTRPYDVSSCGQILTDTIPKL